MSLAWGEAFSMEPEVQEVRNVPKVIQLDTGRLDWYLGLQFQSLCFFDLFSNGISLIEGDKDLTHRAKPWRCWGGGSPSHMWGGRVSVWEAQG